MSKTDEKDGECDREGDDKLKEVSILHERFMFLNKLRVDLSRFFVLVFGAVFVSGFFRTEMDLFRILTFAGVPMVIVGLLLLWSDSMLRARTWAVSEAIRRRVSKGQIGGGDEDPERKKLMEAVNEDYFLPTVIASVNAIVGIMACIGWWHRVGSGNSGRIFPETLSGFSS